MRWKSENEALLNTILESDVDTLDGFTMKINYVMESPILKFSGWRVILMLIYILV